MVQEDKKIIVNQIRTPDGTVLQSRHVHDYVTYTDKNGQHYSVDGGTYYLRRGFDVQDYEEISLYEDSPFEDIRENLYRGGRGKDGTEPLTWVKLSEMNTKWLMNTITYYLKNVQEIKVENTNKLIESLEASDTALISHLIETFDHECNMPEFKGHDKEPGKTLVEKSRHIEYYIQELKYRQDNNIFIEE